MAEATKLTLYEEVRRKVIEEGREQDLEIELDRTLVQLRREAAAPVIRDLLILLFNGIPEPDMTFVEHYGQATWDRLVTFTMDAIGYRLLPTSRQGWVDLDPDTGGGSETMPTAPMALDSPRSE